MTDRIAFVLVTLVVTILGAVAAHADDPRVFSATGLRCEYRTDPLGMDEPAPRLSWIFESDKRADVQTRYRVLVASSLERLGRNEGDLWDTGEIASNEMRVVYAGTPLASRQVCYWRVEVWDRDGASRSSAIARWEMGLLTPGDWTAQWVRAGGTPVKLEVTSAIYSALDGSAHKDVTKDVAALVGRSAPVVAKNEALGGDPAVNRPKRLTVEYAYRGAKLTTIAAEGSASVLPTERAAYLRRSFAIAKPVAKARLYATALGLYEFNLNGERVGSEWLAPGWTDYRKHVQYQVHDVTAQVKEGANVFGAMVAPGWFSGRAGLFHARRFYGAEPSLLAQLEITYADGTVDRIVTDSSWQRIDGPILMTDMMDGEIYDARDEFRWDDPAAGPQTPVMIGTESRTLVAQMDEPVRALREVPARSVIEAPDAPGVGRWIFDLGENMVGVVRLRVRADAGTALTIRHAEMLKPDGGIYTDNLRGAAATDAYICRGGGEEVWNPRFTLHGFRYVEVAGLKEKPGADTVTGILLGSALPSAGTFSCSDERLNTLQANIVRGLHGNYVSVPTDCPQRDERMGWMADTQVFVPTAAYNADIATFMTKWMRDVTDAQREDGAHSDVAPVMKGLTYGTPAWADAGTIVPWTLYQMYGDAGILERNIDSMTRWVDWCRDHSTGLIRDKDRGNDYGDWLSIGADTPKDLIGTAYFARSAQIVAQSLAALGRDEEAKRYAQLAEDVRAAFIARYVGPDGRVAGDTQCGYLLALRFGLLPDELRGPALKILLSDIASRGYRLSTGFVGVGLLLPTLAEAKQDDAAYRLLMQDEFPSWLFSVKHGATTIWERWDGWTPERGVHPDASMNSFNHYSLGSCGQWLFEGVCGIEPDPAHPGFEHFYIRPRTDGPLTHASATYASIRGEIRSAWRVDGDRLTLSVTVPGNTTATIELPSRRTTTVQESGGLVQRAAGVRSAKHDGDRMIIEVGGGQYEFTSMHPVARAKNPVLSGWYADPDAIVIDGTYWIFPTRSDKYERQLAFDAFSSPDLTRWTKHADVLKASDVTWANKAMWAPCVVENHGKFFLFFAANDIQKDGEVGGIGVAVADRPEGPFKDYLGKPLIDKFHNGAQPIDQCVFKDADGRWYMLYGGWRHCNIVRLRDDFRGFEPFDDGTTFKEITPDGYVEGPYMLKRNGKYIFMWSEGGWTGPDYCVAYATADSPLGPFKRIGKILEQDPAVATGAGHHSLINVPGTDDWVIAYHRRPLGETNGNHRVVCLDRLVFDGDAIRPVKLSHDELKGTSRWPATRKIPEPGD